MRAVSRSLPRSKARVARSVRSRYWPKQGRSHTGASCRMEARRSLTPSSVPPSRIGRHEVVCLLGQGGMARVFLALQRGAFDAAKLVVVKQLRREFAEDQEFLAMFVDEARLV